MMAFDRNAVARISEAKSGNHTDAVPDIAALIRATHPTNYRNKEIIS
jgi:hypothetical protein